EVKPGDPHEIVVTVQPGETEAGQAVAGPPTVVVKDEEGNPVPDVDVTVTIVLGSGTFTGGSTTTVRTDADGEAVFSNLVIEKADRYQLQFAAEDSDGNAVTEDSAPFDVKPAVASAANTTAAVPNGV